MPLAEIVPVLREKNILSIVNAAWSAGDASNDWNYDLNLNWNPRKDAGVLEFGGLNNSLFVDLEV